MKNLRLKSRLSLDWCPAPELLRKGLVSESLHEEYEADRETTFAELFFDLIFVVTFARLGEAGREAEDTGISFFDGTYILYFSIFWYHRLPNVESGSVPHPRRSQVLLVAFLHLRNAVRGQ